MIRTVTISNTASGVGWSYNYDSPHRLRQDLYRRGYINSQQGQAVPHPFTAGDVLDLCKETDGCFNDGEITLANGTVIKITSVD